MADLNRPENLDTLNSLIYHSQNNLKILSTKLGRLPRNLCKAMEIVQTRPESLTTREKLECLSAMEILREKFIEFTADSEEMLGYFKDILLEAEAAAVEIGSDKESFMKIVDKRVEIFQSGDPTRTKIQEAYHLIMGLEQWRSRNSQGLLENSEGLLTHQRCEAQIKLLYAKVNRRNEEIYALREKYRNRVEKMAGICSGLAMELKRIKHCVEFELFSTWSCLIGSDGSTEASCAMIYNKILQEQHKERVRARMIREKIIGVRSEFDRSKDYFRSLLEGMSKGLNLTKTRVLKAVINSKKQVQSCRNEVRVLKSDTEIDLEEIRANLVSFSINKLALSGNIEHILEKFAVFKENSEQCVNYIKSDLESFKCDISNYKGSITKKLLSFSNKIKDLKSEKSSLRQIAAESLENFKIFFSNSITALKSGKLKEISRQVRNLRTSHDIVKADTEMSLINNHSSTVNSMNLIKNAQLSWLLSLLVSNKIELSGFKKSISEDLQEFKNIFQSLASLQKKLAENHIMSKQELAANSKYQADLKNDLKNSNATIDFLQKKLSQANQAISLQSEGLRKLKPLQASLRTAFNSAINQAKSELNSKLQHLQSSCHTLQTAHQSLQLHSQSLESKNATLTSELNSCRSLLLNQQKQLVLYQGIIPYLKHNLSQVKKEVAENKECTNRDLEIVKSHISVSSRKYDTAEMYVMQLEQAKMELESSNAMMSRNLERVTDANRELMKAIASRKTTLKRNGQRVLRKLRAFKSVMMQEKLVIRYLNTNLYDWIVPNVVMALEQNYSYREGAGRYQQDEALGRLQLQMKGNRETFGEYKKKMNIAKIGIKSILESNHKAIMNDFSEKLFGLAEFYSGEIARYKRIVNGKDAYIYKLKQVQQNAFEVLRKKNYELRLCVESFLKLSITERDSIKLKLTTKLKNDLEGMKSNIKTIQDEYKSENLKIQDENSNLQRILEARNTLVTPIDQIIRSNQSNLEELRKNCIKNYEQNSKNIEENVQKLDEFSEKIEDLYDEGLEIVNRYKQDSFMDESPEVIFDSIENPEIYDQDLAENSLEISLTSNPDDEENKNSLATNPLMKKYSPKHNKVMRIPTLIKTIESILDEKYRIDNDALQRDRPPLTMTEYLLQSLKNQFNLMADTRLNTILHSFRTSMSDPRIRFYCRLFQVFDPKPISYKLSLYLIKLRYYFNVFVNNQVIPESLNKKSDKMQITETIKRVRRLFNSDIPTGEVVLKQLMPESLQSGTWSRICIQYYLYINAMSPEKCFTSITVDPTMTEAEFVQGLSKIHETFVSEADLRQLFIEISGETLPIAEFDKVFALKFYFDNHQKYSVDQLQFLNALIEGYSSMRIRHYK